MEASPCNAAQRRERSRKLFASSRCPEHFAGSESAVTGTVIRIEETPALLRSDGSGVPVVSVAVAERGVSDYLDSFRLVAAFLAYVDRTFEKRSEAVRQPE